MAVITSVQSGPFNAGSTWDSSTVPVDGDQFIVNYGHIVTVSGDSRVTNGYHDSFVRGKLHIQNSGLLRMNGILYVDNTAGYTSYFAEGVNSGGFFRMDPGSTLEMRGTDAEQHRVQVRNQNRLTCEIIGDNPNPQTTLSSDAARDSAVFSVADASNFRIGDWITVYQTDYGLSWVYNQSDEGFWIHDIENNNIYFKQFVSPEATITGSRDNKIIVDDASVFRKGHKLIFGTGANRNIKEVISIGYGSNTIAFDSNITGSVIGEKIYQTCCEKAHKSGDEVLRISAVTTSDSNSGSNTITVNNPNGFAVGDMILIELNDPLYSNTWDRVADFTISSINGNTISFTSGYTSSATTTLPNNVKSGALVVNMNRNTKIIAAEGTNYGNDNGCFFWSEYRTTLDKRIKIKNCVINIGSNTRSNQYGCFGMRYGLSYYSNGGYGYVSEINGLVLYCVNRRTYSNTGLLWEMHQINFRNNISYNAGSYGGFYYYGNNTGWFNNIMMRCNRGIYSGGTYEPAHRLEYNYVTRCSQGYYLTQRNDPMTCLLRHCYATFVTSRPVLGDYQSGISKFNKCYFNWYINPDMYASRRGLHHFDNCYMGNDWDVTGAGLIYNDSVNMSPYGPYLHNRGDALASTNVCTSYNFKYNGLLISNTSAVGKYDPDMKAWRIWPDRDGGNIWMGLYDTIFVPANTKVLIKASVKMPNSSSNTNYPQLFFIRATEYYRGLYSDVINQTAITSSNNNLDKINELTGFSLEAPRFTSASLTDFETKTLEVPALPFNYSVNVGVLCYGGYGSNYRLGWWQKDLEINLENPNPMPLPYSLLNIQTNRLPVGIKSSFDQRKTIWGGG